MSGNRSSFKLFLQLCLIPLSILLFGCDGDPYQGPAVQEPGDSFPDAAVTASTQEGINPLVVTFDVSGVDGTGAQVTWDFGDGATATTTGNASVSHTFTTPGVATVTATIEDSRVISIPVKVLPDINLVVSSFAIHDEVVPGSPNTVSAIIQNIGKDTFTAVGVDTAVAFISVGYYLSTDEEITVDDIYIGDTSIFIGEFFTGSDVLFGMQGLAPGENYQYNHQLDVKTNVPAGEYFAGAIVDYVDEFHWYDFPRSTDTVEYTFPSRVVVPETNEDDNAKLLTAHKVSVSNESCTDDAFEGDDSSDTATPITVGATQTRNFCFDNSDWLKFDAAQGSVYKIDTTLAGRETDTQLILYDQDGSSILLFHDNIGNTPDETKTVDLESGFPPFPRSEIVWEAPATGTYFVKVRTTACDEDKDNFCIGSPDGVGLRTEYSITLQ
jgi:PKD repeat protein